MLLRTGHRNWLGIKNLSLAIRVFLADLYGHSLQSGSLNIAQTKIHFRGNSKYFFQVKMDYGMIYLAYSEYLPVF